MRQVDGHKYQMICQFQNYHYQHQSKGIQSNSSLIPTQIPATLKMAPARKALIAITSAKATLNKETTGLFITEALHPYNVLVAAGFEVDLASETGTYTADWLSQTPDFLNGDDLTVWNDVNSDFRKKLDNMPKAADLDASQYGIFYASAGHAALIDYPTATSLQKVAEQVWASGGVVASVCHGPAIFANILDRETGKPVIQGRRLTGFTTEAENTMGIIGDLKSWNVELCEELAARLGAKYERSVGIWDDFHVVDGRLVTGQNPASATSTAKAAVEVFEKL
ncbi:ThiJ/PfpI [Penicillium expansum]|nr:ThiJ/PfpI [Penicillium expansum]